MYQLRHGELPFSRLLFQKLLVDQRLELLALEGVDLLLELLSCPATGFSNSSEVIGTPSTSAVICGRSFRGYWKDECNE